MTDRDIPLTPLEQEIEKAFESINKLFRTLPAKGGVTEEDVKSAPEEEEILSEETDWTSAELVSEAVKILKLAEAAEKSSDTDTKLRLLNIADRYITLADIVGRYDQYGYGVVR